MTEKQMFDFLVAGGLSEYGAAALMGHFQAESGMNPRNMQNSYESKLGYTDDSYTEAVDNGSYTNFVYDSVGYGYAQWTYWSRKEALLNFAKSSGCSIGDPEMQLKFVLSELKGYKTVLEALKTATEIRTASDIILEKYESPADQSEAVRQKRAGYGQAIYDRCAGKKEEEKNVGRTAQDYINVWIPWIGFNETNGKFKQIIDIYNSVKPLPRGYAVQYTDEWCDTAVSAAAIAADMIDLIGRECGCEEHIKIFKQLGIWNEDGTITPEPGYIIVYNWDKASQPNDGGADHIGAVESVSNGQVTVIEGNKNEAVARRVISVGNGYIRGYAIPKYSSQGTPQAPVSGTSGETSGGINRTVLYYGTVNTAELNVRTWAGTENDRLKSYPSIKQGTKVGVCDVVKDKDGDPWYFIQISGDQGEKYGFVSAMYITKLEDSKPASTADPTLADDGVIDKTPRWVGKVTASSLNVRTWAGVNNPKIKSWPSLGYGNLVDVCDAVNAVDGSLWYYIRIDGRIYGFVHSAYISRA